MLKKLALTSFVGLRVIVGLLLRLTQLGRYERVHVEERRDALRLVHDKIIIDRGISVVVVHVLLLLLWKLSRWCLTIDV